MDSQTHIAVIGAGIFGGSTFFTTYENEGGASIAHSAMDLKVQPENALPRQSIKTIMLARF